MRTEYKKAVTAAVLVAALIGGAVFVSPVKPLVSSFAVTQEEYDAAHAAAKEAAAATEAKKAEAKEAAKKAAAATQNLEEAEARLNSLTGQVEAKKAEIADTRVKMEKKEQEIEAQNDALNDRLTAMYKTGTAGFVDVILNSEDVDDLLTNVGMVHKILESDQELLKKLQEDYKELKQLKAELEEQEIALEAAQAEAAELKKMYQAEADKLKAMEDELEAQAQELAAAAAAKQKEAEQMIVDAGLDENVSTGKFAWPTKGNYQITSNYGWRICPFHGREFHNGVDIVLSSGTYGSPVYAIADGIVTRASWYGGYGNCIQVAHGKGYSSLYGHLKGYNVSNGQKVHKGDLIGYIGSTGNSTGPHLHFTVFRNGSITNPLGLY
ncbi:MAG: peptidoglycan DD-metalloendopeptidase family protein [Mogibacterium sp.]|nr:peptidoglycan DD-metalloendopeptidase family protein [Mogibacterium sp.]